MASWTVRALVVAGVVCSLCTVGLSEDNKKAGGPNWGKPGEKKTEPAAKEPAEAKAKPEVKKPAAEEAPRRRRRTPRGLIRTGKKEEAEWLIDDFEKGGNLWRVENWANPAACKIDKGELQVTPGAGKHDKSVLARWGRLDMSDRTAWVLDVRNGTAKPVKIALAFWCGRPAKYVESAPVTVKPGLQKDVVLDLQSPKFKTEASKWKHTVKLAGADAVYRACILLYNVKGTVGLDNIRLVKKEAEKTK
jgi:hypothetical protein